MATVNGAMNALNLLRSSMSICQYRIRNAVSSGSYGEELTAKMRYWQLNRAARKLEKRVRRSAGSVILVTGEE